MVDMVVSRLELKSTIARLLKILLKAPVPREVAEPEILPPRAGSARSPPAA